MNDEYDRVDETMHHFSFNQGYDYESEMFIGEFLNDECREVID